MRKGLTLSLAATASLLTASAAYAFGPTVAGVPDVYITKNSTVLSGGGAETLSNNYRFEDAFVIDDYITPGVTSGNGSSSDTLYWGYGVRATVGSGSYYASGAAANQILYKIGSPAGSAIAPIQIAASPNTLAWKNEINVTNGASLKKVSDFGRLSFYNVALSPLPSVTAGSDPLVTSPTLGAQREATLYVTDLSTTPGADNILIVTNGISTDVDTLSGGGAVFTNEATYTSTTSWGSAFILGTDWNGAGQGIVGGNAATKASGTNSGTSLQFTTQLDGTGIPSGAGLYVQFSTAGVPVTTSKVYRLKASVTSSNTVGSVADPTIIAQLSGGVAGTGYYTSAGGAFQALTGSTPKVVSAYLWPLADGTASPNIIVFDSFATTGGTITASSLSVQSFNPALLTGTAALYDAGTGAASTFAVASSTTAGSWTIPTTGAFTILNFASGSAVANFSVAPSSAGNSATLAINTASSSSTSIQGIASWSGSNLYTPSAGKLVVVNAVVKTANLSNKYPKPWLIVDGSAPNFGGAGLLAQSNNDTVFGGGNLTTSGINLRVVYDSFGASANTVTFRGFASVSGTAAALTGDITLVRLTATEYTAPVNAAP